MDQAVQNCFKYLFLFGNQWKQTYCLNYRTDSLQACELVHFNYNLKAKLLVSKFNEINNNSLVNKTNDNNFINLNQAHIYTNTVAFLNPVIIIVHSIMPLV